MPKVLYEALTKLSIEEWLVKTVQPMNRNAGSCASIMTLKEITSWSHLFTIKLETLSREIWSRHPKELLYAEDLLIDSLECLQGRLEG